MLCPEVWNFKAPEARFTTQRLSSNESNHLSTIHSFAYNHLVTVILPDTSKVPDSLSSALNNDCDFYKLKQVKLSEFLARDFIHGFVNSGSLYVLSIDSRIDCDNCASITSSGRLILNLDKSTYQSLGLEGSVSHFNAARYTVNLDLKQKCLTPGKPNYERAKKCLEKLTMNFIVTWEPPNDSVCPSSIAKYFHNLGYIISLSNIQKKMHVLYSLPAPSLEENFDEVVEWMGMVSLDADLQCHAPDNYITTYAPPEPHTEVGQVRFIQWRGFFTANQITGLFNQLSKMKGGSEWVGMYVQGFSDSPIAWNGEEHHYYTNGDNSYTFILTKNDVITCTQKCSRKKYNNKRKGKPL